MRALFIDAPKRAAVRELSRPAPGRGEVRISVRYVGLCGSDLATFRGLNPLVSYPRVPGHKLSGVIESVGNEVPADLRPGRVVSAVPYTACNECSACGQGRPNACRHNQTLGVQRDGALAEQIVLPAAQLLTSSQLPLRQMALIEPLAVGWHASVRGRVTAGETIAVMGCGMVGLGAIAGAHACGGRVIAVDIATRKLELARAAGAHETVNVGAGGLREQLQALTNGHGPELLIEAVGRPDSYRACVEAAAFAGRIVYVGYTKQPVEYETKLFVQKELDILGSRNALLADFASVLRRLEHGDFPVAPLITHQVALDEAPAALAMWDRDPTSVTKILVAVQPDAAA